MYTIYSLGTLSEIIFDDYNSVVNFSIDLESLKVHIKTVNGKTYHYAVDFTRLNEMELQEWINKVPEYFKQDLVNEALGKTYRSLEGVCEEL